MRYNGNAAHRPIPTTTGAYSSTPKYASDLLANPKTPVSVTMISKSKRSQRKKKNG